MSFDESRKIRFFNRTVAFLTVLVAMAGMIVLADISPSGAMLQTPDVSASHIVFSYANDLWVVAREGGQARPLSSPAGRETFPRFSPDGKTIAFIGNYEGNPDLYTLGAEGGVPFRVTYHPGFELLSDWTADGGLIFSSSMASGIRRSPKIFTVSATGGMPVALPVPYGAAGTLSGDGERLLYTPSYRDGRTWKRYKGGMAANLWIFNLKTNKSQKITEWDGTDTQPMWHGDNVYYLSDAGPNHRLNIWLYNAEDGSHSQVTKFKKDDVRWPAVGPGPDGKGEIQLARGIEVGHIFQLGTKYSKSMNAVVLGEDGKSHLMPMGCYGIGVSRIVAAAIEQNHDDSGICWPEPIAPFQVAILPMNAKKSHRVREAAEKLYEDLMKAGVEVLLDDRNVRPGVMFNDMELIGIPHRVVIGERSLDEGVLEYRKRTAPENENISLENALTDILAKLA